MNTCRVRVLQDRTSTDVSLPARLPVGEVLPPLIDLIFEAGSPADRARPWQLVHPVRGALDHASTLDDLGVVDGMTLLLDEVAPPPPVVLVGDVAEAIGRALAARGTDFGDRVAQWWAGAVLALAGGLAGVVGGRSLAVGLAAGAVAVVLSLAGGILGRLRTTRGMGAALAIASMTWWASASAAVLRPEDGNLLLALAAAAGGVAAGAAAATLNPVTMFAGFGSGLAFGAVGIELALFSRVDRSQLPVAAAAVALVVLSLAVLPIVTPMVSGLARLADERVLLETVLRKVDADRKLQEWMSAALLVALLPPIVALARADGGLADVLLLLLAVVLAIRARRMPYAGEHIPLVVASGLSAAAALLAVALAGPGAVAAVAIGLATVVAVALSLPRAASDRKAARTQQMVARLDVASVSALLLVAAGTTGAFSAIAGLAS